MLQPLLFCTTHQVNRYLTMMLRFVRNNSDIVYQLLKLTYSFTYLNTREWHPGSLFIGLQSFSKNE